MPAIRHDRIVALRKKLGMTQEDVARAAGCNQGHLSSIEHGRIPSVGARILINLARVLETNVDYLMGISDDPTPNKRLKEDDLTRDEEDILLAYRNIRSLVNKRLVKRIITAMAALETEEIEKNRLLNGLRACFKSIQVGL